MRGARRAAWALVVAGAACSSYGGEPAVSGDGDAAADGTGVDAGVDGASSDGDAAEPRADVEGDRGSLLRNTGFELPGPICGEGWAPENAVATLATDSRSGTQACRVCLQAATKAYYSIRAVPQPPARAGSYTLEAWFRLPPRAGPYPPDVRLVLRWPLPDGGFAGQPPPQRRAGNAYDPLQVSAVLANDLDAGLDLRLEANGEPNTCFLVDDITLVYTPP